MDDDDDDIIDDPIDPNDLEIVDLSHVTFSFQVVIDEPTFDLAEALAKTDGVSVNEAVQRAIHAHAKVRAVEPSPQR